MRKLQKSELSEVKPKFRPAVEAAWTRGEEVPYGVTLISDRPPTESEIAIGRSLEEAARKLTIL